MSILRSYYSRNNTISLNSFVNTGRNPVMQLFYGQDLQSYSTPNGFTRFIFDLDLALLNQSIADTTISTGCTTAMTHTLVMTNTISFNEDLLNDTASDSSIRATSFDLILFRIPNFSGDTGNPQNWDEGVGYDFVNIPAIAEWTNNKAFSLRPSNWYQSTTIEDWSYPGLYDNTNSITGLTGLNFSALTIVDRQHFEYGNEDIRFDMTNEINDIIYGNLTGVTGWGIAYVPEVENITGLTATYSVGFFTKNTQTFYQPYLQTTYDDLIEDDRNTFVVRRENKLYLYSYVNGDFYNLDQTPTVDILDPNGDPVPGMTSLPTCLRTKGVYEVVIPPISGYSTPCQFTDVWTDLFANGNQLQDVENQFILQGQNAYFNLSSQSKDPMIYGFDFSGIKQNEKILGTDIRKVMVTIKKAYTAQNVLQNIEASYRVYVKEGQTEVQVQDWTPINRTPNEYYFMFDTRDKIPNQYYVDIKVNTSGEKDTYQRVLTFEIVNRK